MVTSRYRYRMLADAWQVPVSPSVDGTPEWVVKSFLAGVFQAQLQTGAVHVCGEVARAGDWIVYGGGTFQVVPDPKFREAYEVNKETPAESVLCSLLAWDKRWPIDSVASRQEFCVILENAKLAVGGDI